MTDQIEADDDPLKKIREETLAQTGLSEEEAAHYQRLQRVEPNPAAPMTAAEHLKKADELHELSKISGEGEKG